jgi:hypothetical protein
MTITGISPNSSQRPQNDAALFAQAQQEVQSTPSSTGLTPTAESVTKALKKTNNRPGEFVTSLLKGQYGDPAQVIEIMKTLPKDGGGQDAHIANISKILTQRGGVPTLPATPVLETPTPATTPETATPTPAPTPTPTSTPTPTPVQK